uniref:Evasin n=1 Tax=Amblyomma parvum TaxID=251391 RepID=A0A023FXS5_AMBPA
MFLWMLNFRLLLVLAASVGHVLAGPPSIPGNESIPGCGDAGTTTAPEDNPKHYGTLTDKKGCTLPIIGTWMTAVDHQHLQGTRGERRGPTGKVNLPASCRKNCHGRQEILRDGIPCRKVVGNPKGSKKHLKSGCLRGKCLAGQCVNDGRRISCYVPRNITDTEPTPGLLAE